MGNVKTTPEGCNNRSPPCKPWAISICPYGTKHTFAKTWEYTLLNYCKIPNQSFNKNWIRPMSNDNLPMTV